jgi:hypothetical protein
MGMEDGGDGLVIIGHCVLLVAELQRRLLTAPCITFDVDFSCYE